MTNEETVSKINELIQTCKDGQEGFKTAAENVEDTRMKDLFYELSQQRSRFAGELQEKVTRLGSEAEDSGSIAGLIHRGWMNIKTAVSSGDKESILNECERGEDSAVDAYKEALEADLPGDVAQVVRSQYADIKMAHNRVKALRDTAEAASN